MATYSTNEFRSGLKLLLDGAPCAIIHNEFVKPGKGQAFNRVKYRQLLTGKVLEKTFKSGETVEAADVIDRSLQYLYQDGDAWHFMDNDSFEQVSLDAAVVGDNRYWLKEQDMIDIVFWNDAPITIEPPTFVVLAVTDCAPGVKGDTVSGGTKEAILETGAEIRVPLFVNVGDLLKVDTRTAEYVSRAKDGE